jgi:hypothetical protein
MNLRNKKAEEQGYEEITFIVVNLAFFCLMLLFVYKTTQNDALFEETTAKTLALTIDSLKPNSQATITIADILERSNANDYLGNGFSFDFNTNKITIKTKSSGGYSFPVYTLIKDYTISENKKILIIKT